jgi:hypothetical protein
VHRLLILAELHVIINGVLTDELQKHCFVLKLDSKNVPFLIDTCEEFCYKACHGPTSSHQEIDFNSEF